MSLTTAEKIKVMQAHEDGLDIEVQILYGWEAWDRNDEPEWNWEDNNYRIKPDQEPLCTSN